MFLFQVPEDTFSTSLTDSLSLQRPHMALQSTGDGSCLYNSVSILLNGDESLAKQLRQLVADELKSSANLYATHELLEKAALDMGCDIPTVLHTLLESEDCSDIEASIIAEAHRTINESQHSSMLQVMALSTVINMPITSLFPNVQHYARSLYHCTVKPIVESADPFISATQLPIVILWTAYGAGAAAAYNRDRTFVPNHVVPVIEKSAVTTHVAIPSIRPKPPIHPFWGPPKPKKAAVTKVDKDRLYDQNSRNRHFQQHWQTTYTWLELDKANGAMFCRTCRTYPQHSDKNGMFVQGNTCYRLDSIKAHSNSAGHKRSVAKDTTVEIKTTPAHQILLTLNKLTVERLKHLFRNCHAIGKKGRPYTDYVWICLLDKLKGVDIGDTYLNDKAAAVFMHHIAEVAREELVESVNSSQFISLICDGSTDSAVLEQEIIYVRYVDSHGHIMVKFLACKPMVRPNARNITTAIVQAAEMAGAKDWTKKLIALGSDGAPVMQGRRGGVISYLRKEVGDWVVGIHCSAHRLELAVKKAIQGVKLASDVDKLLLDLYIFYHASTVRRATLTSTYDALSMPHSMPTRVGGSRWLGHTLRALTTLWKGFRGVVTHLQQVEYIIIYYYELSLRY